MAAFVCLSLALPASIVFAQTSVSGSIGGIVTDRQGRVVPNTAIEVVGPPVAGRRRVLSDADGFYRLADLPPGVYALTATRDGFGPVVHSQVMVRASLTLAIDLTLDVAPVEVKLDVVVSEPLLDITSASQALNITGELQGRLPLSSRRDWADFLLVTPGVVSNDAGFYYAHGSSFESHVMQLDGVDLAAAQQNFNGYINLSTDTPEDVQVKAAGIDPSAPLGAGLVISMVSRSGADRFSGVEGLSVRPYAWNANNNPGGTTSATSAVHLDLSLGGPIQRGRWWFFGSYRYEKARQDISRTSEQVATLAALLPGFEPFSNDSSARIPFIKITGQIAPGHQVFGFHHADRRPSASARETDGIPLTRSLLGGRVEAIGLTSVWGPLLTRAVMSFNNKGGGTEALGSGPALVVHQSTIPSGGLRFGTGPIAFLGNTSGAFEDESSIWTASADATYYRSAWHGAHEIGAGFTIQRRREETIDQYVNGGFAQEQLVLRDPANPAAGLIPFVRDTFTPDRLTTVNSRALDVGLYLRDAWRLTSRLSLDLGARVDVIRRFDDQFGVDTQRSIEFGPRAGVTYALAADAARVVRASWGRIHDALSTNTIAVGDSASEQQSVFDSDLDGVFDTVFTFPALTALSDRYRLDPDRSQPYLNEWTIGYGQRLPGHISVDAAIIRRAYRNRTAFVEVNGVYEGSRFVGYRNPSANDVYDVTGNRWNWPVYTGLETRLTRQTGSLQLIAGYTRGFQHLAGTWQPNDPASFIQPAAFPNDRGIGNSIGSKRPGASNSLSGFNEFTGPQWRDHVIRAGVTYRAPAGWLVATTYSFQSGVWSSPVMTVIDVPDPQFGDPVVRLPNGRDVRNPLATTIRFAYPTRGEGQFPGSPIHMWNVRVGREFSIPRLRARTDILLDVFNVPNAGAYHQFAFGANQQYNPVFRQGQNRQVPRSAAVSARVSF